MRSRAVSLPFWCWASMRSWPPPSSDFSRSSCSFFVASSWCGSSTSSAQHAAEVLGVDERDLAVVRAGARRLIEHRRAGGRHRVDLRWQSPTSNARWCTRARACPGTSRSASPATSARAARCGWSRPAARRPAPSRSAPRRPTAAAGRARWSSAAGLRPASGRRCRCGAGPWAGRFHGGASFYEMAAHDGSRPSLGTLARGGMAARNQRKTQACQQSPAALRPCFLPHGRTPPCARTSRSRNGAPPAPSPPRRAADCAKSPCCDRTCAGRFPPPRCRI
jgi:hypothetical protein